MEMLFLFSRMPLFLLTLIILYATNEHSVTKAEEHSFQQNHALINPTYQKLFHVAVTSLQNSAKPWMSEEHQNEYVKELEMVTDFTKNMALLTEFEVGEKEHLTESLVNCLTDLREVINAAEERQIWAIDMLDAAGKPSSGVLMGSVVYPGNYEECYGIITNQTFNTRYCLAHLSVSRVEGFAFPQAVPFGIGLCVPDTCDSHDIQLAEQLALSYLNNTNATAKESMCHAETNTLSSLAIIAICLCSVFLCLVVVATLCEVFYVNGLWRRLWARPAINAVLLDVETDGEVLTFANRSLESSYDTPVDIHKDVQSLPLKLLLSFSAYTNGKKVLSTKQQSGNIACINGIKFISLTWVILGHSCLIGIPIARDISHYVNVFLSRWTFMAISNALVSVDTFFVLSGCLMMYSVMKQIQTSSMNGRFFLFFYIHRIWRLTPTYMLILVTYLGLFKYISNGPFWPQQGFETGDCKDTWWTNLLYINNFVRSKQMCMAWSWYLADDMQFYIISPLVFIPLVYFGWKAFLVPLGFLVATATCAGLISHAYDLQATLSHTLNTSVVKDEYFTVYYIKPYNRIGPYMIGMVTGYMLHRCKCQAKIPKLIALAGWMLATSIALAVVYGLCEHTIGNPVSLEVAALYNALHKIGWGLAVAWVIFACANGYGGFVNTFLSWRLFVPLSRLTLCAYLLHPMVIYFYYYSQQSLVYIDGINLSYMYLGTVVLTYAVAFVTSLVYESPVIGLEKFLRTHRWSGSQSQPSDIIPIIT